jgi:hypothetical protein
MRIALLTVMVFGLCSVTFAQESVLDRRIRADAPGAAVVWVPDSIASGIFAWRIAQAAGVPMMFEALPLDYRDPAIVGQRFDLAGHTVREALDIFIAQDPRYQWDERDGVVVIRPTSLSRSPEDALNQPIAGVRGDQLRLEDVLSRVTTAVVGARGASMPATAVDSHAFALDAPSGSILDVLVAAARAHGGVMWSVPDGARGRDQAGFSLGFKTFTGGGAGTTGSDPR